jgi:hypothetical protein
VKYDWAIEPGPGAIEHSLALLDTGEPPTYVRSRSQRQCRRRDVPLPDASIAPVMMVPVAPSVSATHSLEALGGESNEKDRIGHSSPLYYKTPMPSAHGS